MGRPFKVYLNGGKVYCCRGCRTHLAQGDELMSRAFHSKNGKAYLFERAANVSCGSLEERMMTTGMHVVCDIACSQCSRVVGWKYEVAYEKSQKYKEGKFILERANVSDYDRSIDGLEDEVSEDESCSY